MNGSRPRRLSPIRRFAAGSALSLVLAAAAMGAAQAQSLRDTMTMSYQSNPTLSAQRQSLRATNEQIAQALSGYRPTVEAGASAGIGWSDIESEEGGGTETINPASIGIDISQPLYSGGSTAASVDRAENTIQAARANYVLTEQDVLLNAVIAYMNVVREQAILDLAINNERVLQRQLDAASDRFEVGEITRTDVSQAESRLAGAVADRIEAEGLLRIARATFARIVGVMPGVLQPPEPTLALPATLEEAVLMAEASNPSIISAQFAEEAAQAGIDVVRGEMLPQVSLNGSISRDYEPSGSIDRRDNAQIVARVTVPLYQSGSVSSRVREARFLAAEQRIRIEESRRAVIANAISSWEALETARASIQSLAAQIRAAEIALDGVQQEAQVGSRTILDVLDAEQELLDARVALVRAERDETVAAFQLLATVGGLTARNLALPVDYYEFDPDYDEARTSWWGTSIDEEAQ